MDWVAPASVLSLLNLPAFSCFPSPPGQWASCLLAQMIPVHPFCCRWGLQPRLPDPLRGSVSPATVHSPFWKPLHGVRVFHLLVSNPLNCELLRGRDIMSVVSWICVAGRDTHLRRGTWVLLPICRWRVLDKMTSRPAWAPKSYDSTRSQKS